MFMTSILLAQMSRQRPDGAEGSAARLLGVKDPTARVQRRLLLQR